MSSMPQAGAPFSGLGGSMERASVRQSGIALVMVLWVVSLLSVMALSVAASVRSGMLLARNAVDEVRAKALTDAAVSYAALQLLSGIQNQDPEGGPVLLSWSFEGFPLELEIHSEAERLDLNQAGPQELAEAFDEAGVEPEIRDRLVDAIIDWRDPDSLRGLHGAEDADYTAAGLPYGSKDQPFESVDEVEQILGFPRELRKFVQENFTVGDGRVNPPPQAYDSRGLGLMASSRMSGGVEESKRAGLGRRGVQRALGVRRSAHQDLYRVQIAYGLHEGVVRRAEGLVRLGGGSALPYQVLWTRQDAASAALSAQDPSAAPL